MERQVTELHRELASRNAFIERLLASVKEKDLKLQELLQQQPLTPSKVLSEEDKAQIRNEVEEKQQANIQQLRTLLESKTQQVNSLQKEVKDEPGRRSTVQMLSREELEENIQHTRQLHKQQAQKLFLIEQELMEWKKVGKQVYYQRSFDGTNFVDDWLHFSLPAQQTSPGTLRNIQSKNTPQRRPAPSPRRANSPSNTSPRQLSSPNSPRIPSIRIPIGFYTPNGFPFVLLVPQSMTVEELRKYVFAECLEIGSYMKTPRSFRLIQPKNQLEPSRFVDLADDQILLQQEPIRQCVSRSQIPVICLT